MHLKAPPEVVCVFWLQSVLNAFQKAIYTWYFCNLIDIQSKKHMKWPSDDKVH